MRLGQQVKRLRKSLKLTQKEFAERIPGRVDDTYIGKIERGRQLPSLKLVERTARAYGVSVLYFFLEDGGAEAEDFKVSKRFIEAHQELQRQAQKVAEVLDESAKLLHGAVKGLEGALKDLGERGRGEVAKKKKGKK